MTNPSRRQRGEPVSSISIERLIVLDRDGVINVDYGYIGTVDRWEWCPGAPESIAALWDAGFWPIICTNQSGVGRGLFTADQYWDLQAEIGHQYYWHFSRAGAYHPQLSRNYPTTVACFHKPEDNCNCRKPKLGLWDEITRMFGRLDLANSWFLDDKFENLEFGRQIGLKLAWITTTDDDVREPLDYDVYGSLHHFTETLLQKKIPWTHHDREG